MRGGHQLEDATASKHAQVSCGATRVNEQALFDSPPVCPWVLALFVANANRPLRHQMLLGESYGHLGLVGERKRELAQR